MEEISSISLQLKEASNAQQELIEQNDKLSKEIQIKNNQLEQLASELTEKKQEIATEREEKVQLATELQQKEEEFESQADMLKQETQATDDVLERCRDEIQKLIHKGEEMTTYLDNRTKGMDAQAIQLEQRLNNLHQRFQQCSNTIRLVSNKKQEEIEQVHDSMQTQTAAVEKERHQLLENNTKLTEKCTSLEIANKELSIQTNSLQEVKTQYVKLE